MGGSGVGEVDGFEGGPKEVGERGRGRVEKGKGREYFVE